MAQRICFVCVRFLFRKVYILLSTSFTILNVDYRNNRIYLTQLFFFVLAIIHNYDNSTII